MVREEDEDFWFFVVQVECALLLSILLFLALGHYSREFRILVVWFVENQIRERFRRLVAGQ